MLADLLDWLAMAEEKVSRPNPPVTHHAAITEMLNELTVMTLKWFMSVYVVVKTSVERQLHVGCLFVLCPHHWGKFILVVLFDLHGWIGLFTMWFKLLLLEFLPGCSL